MIWWFRGGDGRYGGEFDRDLSKVGELSSQ
jgi:hypothetical protein